MTTKTLSYTVVAAAMLLLSASCRPDEGKYIPDVSGIRVDAPIRHFERELFALDTNAFATEIAALEAAYPVFSEVLFDRVLGATDRRIAPGGRVPYLRGFAAFPPVRRLADTVAVVFRDTAALRDEWEQALTFYRHYFPERPLPDLTTFVSEYSIQGFVYDTNSVALGLDYFLGRDYPYQQYNPGNPNFSTYFTRTFTPEHAIPKAVKIVVDDLVGPQSGNRLLDYLIHEGKKLYLAEQLLPYTPDSLLTEFSAAETAWVNDNELEIWSFFLDEDLLYSSDFQKFRSYVQYAPTSAGMPEAAPSRTGSWLGWQIVKRYMARFPDTTLTALIEQRDAQELLSQSRYKPRR